MAKFYPHYNEATIEFSKCINFENGLHSEIKKAIWYHRICKFLDLVNSCRIFEEDNKDHYKNMIDKRGKQQQNRGKPYNVPVQLGNQRAYDGRSLGGRGADTTIRCYKCGELE